MSMENRLFAVKTPHEMLDCCFLFASRLLVSGQWYIGVGQLVDDLYDVLLTDGDVTVLPHPHSAPAWELPYERIAELPKPYRGSDAELPLPLRLLPQMDKRLLPVHDEAVLYPYRVLSCLSSDSSVAEYFTRKEALAAEREDGRDAVLMRLDELREDYGIAVYPIVTVREIIAFLHNRELDGRVYIDDEMKGRMEAYLEQYGAR